MFIQNHVVFLFSSNSVQFKFQSSKFQKNHRPDKSADTLTSEELTYPLPFDTFQDEFPFPTKVGYVSFQKRVLEK